MLDIEHLYFSYTGREPWLLEDISLHVPKGAYISIVGNNGSGKSTLLKLILGFLSPVKGTISSTYGFRSSPGGVGSTYHEGIDIAVDYGSPIEATASGVVTQAGWVGGYGNLVEIKHDGGLVTRYGHNSALLVSVGQEVEQGTVIALAGSTGNSTGPHCHYEVRINGDAVDPTYFLPGNY